MNHAWSDTFDVKYVHKYLNSVTAAEAPNSKSTLEQFWYNYKNQTNQHENNQELCDKKEDSPLSKFESYGN